MKNILFRVIMGYLGALIITLIFLPLAMVYNAAGHSFMYLGVLAPSLGQIIGFFISDLKRNIKPTGVIIRSFMSLIAIIGFMLLLGSIQINEFFINDSWIFIGLLSPLVSGISTEYILRNSRVVR